VSEGFAMPITVVMVMMPTRTAYSHRLMKTNLKMHQNSETIDFCHLEKILGLKFHIFVEQKAFMGGLMPRCHVWLFLNSHDEDRAL